MRWVLRHKILSALAAVFVLLAFLSALGALIGPSPTTTDAANSPAPPVPSSRDAAWPLGPGADRRRSEEGEMRSLRRWASYSVAEDLYQRNTRTIEYAREVLDATNDATLRTALEAVIASLMTPTKIDR